MALDKQNIPVSLSQGVDTKTDPKQLAIGKMTVLQNGIFQTTKEIRKRNGFAPLTQNILTGGSISNGQSLATYNNELIELDGNSLYSYNSSGPNWVSKGLLKNVSTSVTQIVRNSSQQSLGDSAINGTLQAYAWCDADGFNFYSIYDVSTGQSIIENQQLSVFGGPVKVLSVGSNFVFIYYNTSNFATLYYRAVSVTLPTFITAQTTIATDLNTSNFLFDAEVIGSNIIIAYGTSGPSIALYSLSPTLVLSSQYVAVTSTTPSQGLTVFGDGSSNSWVAWGDGTDVNCLIVNSILSGNVHGKTIIAAVTALVNLTGIVTGTTGTIYYETGISVSSVLNPSTYSSLINQNTMTTSGTVGSASILNRGLGLASKAFAYQGTYYMFTMFPTYLQSLYFLIDQSANVIAKYTQGLGGEIQNGRILPEVNILSAGVFQTVNECREQVFAPKNLGSGRQPGAFSNTGIQSISINFNGTWPSKINLGDNLHYSGGYVHMYDGLKPVEHMFHIYPEGVSNVVQTNSGGIGTGASSAALNQIQYVSVYRWVDNQGQYHRSCPSIPVTVQLPVLSNHTFTGTTTANSTTVSAVSSFTDLVIGQVLQTTNFPVGSYITSLNVGASTLTMSINATASGTSQTFSTQDLGSNIVTTPSLRVSAKTNIVIEIYRTQNNQSIFYLVGQVPNNSAADSVPFQDVLPDSQIIGLEQLYTTGGEVENIAAPAITCMTTFKNRSIAIPQNSVAWWFSKQVIPGSPVEFSDLFTENVDERINYISAVSSLDEKLILFGPTSKFYVVGDGPAPSGVNNDFTEAQKLAGVTGCTNQASILEIPIGLIYQDPTKGIYLLDRSLQEQYIGADVEAFNSFTVTSAHVIPGQTIIRLTMSNGVSLTYDYIVNQWGVDLYAAAATDSTLFNSIFTYVTAAGLVEEETPGSYTDNSLVVPLSLTTGWMSFAQLEGFQRVYELQILGQYFSPHTLMVNIYTDFSNTIKQTAIIPVLSDPGLYQFRIHLSTQKCETIKIQIVESQASSFGQGLSISGLAFRVGVKQGLFKLPAVASY